MHQNLKISVFLYPATIEIQNDAVFMYSSSVGQNAVL